MSKNLTSRVRVSTECYKLISKTASTNEKIQAASGNANLSGLDTAAALFLLVHDRDANVKKAAMENLISLDVPFVIEQVKKGLNPRILRFFLSNMAKSRALVTSLLVDPSTPEWAFVESVSFITPQIAAEILSYATINIEIISRIVSTISTSNANIHNRADTLKVFNAYTKNRVRPARDKSNYVAGDLSLFGLPELLQILELNRRSGVIKVNGGMLYFRGGSLVHSVFGNKTGEDAFRSIFALKNSKFIYYHDRNEGIVKTISKTAQQLVMGAFGSLSLDEDDILNGNLAVKGSLKAVDMVELSQIFEHNMRTAVINVSSDLGKGMLFCHGGDVKHAILGSKVGAEAAYEIFAWNNGRFEIGVNVSPYEETISCSMQGVVLEAMRLLDESRSNEHTSPVADSSRTTDDSLDSLQGEILGMPVSERITRVFKGSKKALDLLAMDEDSLVRKAVKVKVSKTVKAVIDECTSFDDKKRAAEDMHSFSLVEKVVMLFYLAHDTDAEVRSIARNIFCKFTTGNLIEILKTDLHSDIIFFLAKLFADDQDVCRAIIENKNTEEETFAFIIPKLDKDNVEYIASIIERFRRPLPLLEQLLLHGAVGEECLDKIKLLYDELVEKKRSVELSGDLLLITLPDLMQCIEQSKKNAVIVLRKNIDGKDCQGILYFCRGSIIQAYVGKLESEDAFFELFSWTDAKFRMVIAHRVDEQRKITRNNNDLIMDGAMKLSVNDKVAPPCELEVTGDSSIIDLPELALVLEANRNGCFIDIEHSIGDEKARLKFVDGSIVEASVSKTGPTGTEITGFDAVLRILSWSGVVYRLYSTSEVSGAVEPVSPMPVYNMILESMRLVDEGEINELDLPELELTDDEFEAIHIKIQNMSISEKIKSAVKGGKAYRKILINSQNKLICTAVIKNPRISEGEIEVATQNRNVHQDVLRLIALNQEWVKKYHIKFNMLSNPKTPLEISMRYLPFLRFSDLVLLSKNRNIPSALVSAAKRLATDKAS